MSDITHYFWMDSKMDNGDRVIIIIILHEHITTSIYILNIPFIQVLKLTILLPLTNWCALGRSSLHEWCLILYGTKYSPRSSPPIYPVEQSTKPNTRKNSKNSKKSSKKSKLKKLSTTPVSTFIKQNVSSYKPNVHFVLFPIKNSSKLSPTLTDNIQTYPSSYRLYSLQNVDGRPAKKNLSPERNISPTTTGKNVCMEITIFFACHDIIYYT